jgi:cytidine deaminase
MSETTTYDTVQYRRNEKVLEHLSKLACDIVSPVRNYRLAAGITLKNNLISFGFASYKTDPFQARWAKNVYAIHLHAEVSAIKNALKRISTEHLSKSTLYVTRVRLYSDSPEDYDRAMSKPCIGCQRCIAEFGIKNVVFTTAQGHAYL